jgi:hypothetical protein
MDLIQQLLPHQTDLSLQSWSLERADQQITLHLASTRSIAHCPLCHCPPDRVHSHYERTLKDLSVDQFHLKIIVIALAQEWIKLVRQRLPQSLESWLERAKIAQAKHFRVLLRD